MAVERSEASATFVENGTEPFQTTHFNARNHHGKRAVRCRLSRQSCVQFGGVFEKVYHWISHNYGCEHTARSTGYDHVTGR
jgi:hypothetical protein